jgi:hypothetical protein
MRASATYSDKPASEGDLQQRGAVMVEAVAVQHNPDEPGSFLVVLPPVRKITALTLSIFLVLVRSLSWRNFFTDS